MESIRTLIADDEPVALRGLRRLLEEDANIDVVGEAASGDEVVELVETERPDLLLLDIQMPGLNGLECVARLPAGQRPVTVFITAHESYALEAFEVEAVDYLLKPFSDERFAAAIARAKERVRSHRLREAGARVAELLGGTGRVTGGSAGEAGPDREDGPLTRLLIGTRERMTFVEATEIDWIGAADYMAELHVGGRTHLVRRSLVELEQRLDPRVFVRVHRSAIVNLRSIREIQPYFNGQYILILSDGTRLTVSRRRRAALEQVLGQKL